MRMSVDPEGRLIYKRGQENLADGLHDHGTGKFVRESAHTTDDAEARKVPALHMTEITLASFTVNDPLVRTEDKLDQVKASLANISQSADTGGRSEKMKMP